jgi:hypothetical protein
VFSLKQAADTSEQDVVREAGVHERSMRKETNPFHPFVKAVQDAVEEAAKAYTDWEQSAEHELRRDAQRRRRSGCGQQQRGRHRQRPHEGAGGLGVRRPLRFMVRQLELTAEQSAELASILDEIRYERAQVELDVQRTQVGFADAFGASELNAEALRQLAQQRVRSQERLAGATVRCLERTHALLDEEQRKRLTMLLRTGALSI